MKKLLRFLKPFLMKYWRRALVGVAMSIPMAAIKSYEAYFVKKIIDEGFTPESGAETAYQMGFILIGLAILNYPIRFTHFYYVKSVVESITNDLRSALTKKLQTLPVSFFGQTKQGKIISITMADTNQFSQGFRNIIDLIREPLTAMGLLGVAFYQDWQLTIVILIVSPFFILIFDKTGKKLRHHELGIREESANINHEIAEGIMGQKIIKAFNLQNYINLRFNRATKAYMRKFKDFLKVEEHSHPLIELVGALGFGGVVIFAHHRIVSGELTTGGFMSFVAALALFMDPVRKFSHANVKINQAVAAGERILQILEKPDETDQGNEVIENFSQGIEFKNISFSYGDNEVLKDFSLQIKKGQKIGLVGLSGSGKSTLISLLLRLYNIQKGEILIDAKPLPQIKLHSLREQFSLVTQDVFLFNDTVRENICVGKNLSEDEINEGLRISYAADFIQDLPQGIETIIGDRGMRLSGGQAQRLTIARAFLKNSPILLFDEATSALDNESEKIVQKALEQVAGDKTVIAVAHRLSTIQNYDKIVVMKEGRKVEEGTHDELIKLKGEYYKLYELSKK
ncbi:MAG: ABC transporter ATP-binding protein [Bacteriovoracaceae bacterium]|nr:ABC transporter ATP-binding protein [Bacteriovoracaceae bacterium]